MAFVNERPGTKPSDGWRTIDYERNAVLKRADGLPHGGGSWFTLTWQDQSIRFAAYEKLNGYLNPEDKTKGLRKLFTVFQINISQHLENEKKEIEELISNALSEYRELYQHSNIAEVQIDFSQCVYHKVD